LLVVSENLHGIVNGLGLCPSSLVEEFSIGIRLHSAVRRVRKEGHGGQFVFGNAYDPSLFYHKESQTGRDLVLDQGDCVLACSAERYRMPPGYFGLVQTRGSLARMFVSACCNDGQIEPGFDGRITLELTSHAPFQVVIPVGSRIAQLFIFRCSTEVGKPYDGSYQNAEGPTVPTFGEVQ
jgi:deoxycytidine triphosphate deaminase